MQARGRDGGRAGADFRHRRPLRADARARPRRLPIPPSRRWSSKLETNTAANGISLFGLRRSAPGHRACRRPGTGTDLAWAADRLRRQPHLHPRRLRRLRLRHRRLRGRACADDADAVAEEAEAHARRRSTASAAPGVAAKDIALVDHRADRRRRRARPCDRICRQRHRGAVDGRAHDFVQHVDRGRRPLRHRRARRDDIRLSEGPPVRADRARRSTRGRGLVCACAPTPTRCSIAK